MFLIYNIDIIRYIILYAYLDWEITSCQHVLNCAITFALYVGSATRVFTSAAALWLAQVTRKYEKNIGKSSKRHWHERTSSIHDLILENYETTLLE